MVTTMNGGRRITTHEAQVKTATVAERWGERSNLEAALRTCRAKYTALCRAWTHQYDALAALDQLFIAV